jgi:hypothetical protein
MRNFSVRWEHLRPLGAYRGMVDHQNPFADLGLERAIHLRWTLRDINAKRLVLSPVSDDDLSLLAERGLVELSDGMPRLTEAGLEVIN